MPVTTFAVPVLAGKTDAWKKAVAEDERATEERLRGVFIEAGDPANIVAKYLSSDAPFDKWFTESVLKGVHGISAAPPGNETFVNWSA
jgi:hypothetical protein